ncbi:MAG: hypothetical protein EOO99_11945 [Pedobacter sp.]|nr:MAG: hypothetical protein EOO99_11945 [Pedobacter sp.]
MKLKITLILLICFSKIYSQKIEKEIGEIKITQEGFYFEDYLKSKKRKVSKSEFYFDNFGNILEKISYGRQHYNKLNVIGDIEQYSYENEKLISKKHWISSCENESFSVYNTELIYDENNLLIKEIFSNPISQPFVYKYEKNKIEIHSGNFYIQKVFDEQNRIIQCNQIFEETNKIRWQYLYEYRDNCRIANFQTYYGDGKESSKREIVVFDKENRKISEEIYNYNRTKIVFKYSENGVINEVAEYESSLEKEDYKLLRLTKIKINKSSKKLTKEIIEKINSELDSV